MARSRKRFIAGATCPSCKAQDTLMVYMEDDQEHVTCVECDYQMSEKDQAQEKSKAQVSADQVIGIFKPH
ncbi:YheV family putative zinc ribbon protein [Aliidiomarina sanyensis]|uniref:DNA-binding protein n=1 Tax=Aliidiomarina sanyensis TaxID=1249555 RepID=A0A432WPB3_9GAMM|nr:YheV family putative zinc ribbon protein [Aliidiomarina sanyensis]RUO35623.1 DNA-binding protein [Aliidiomarina sanyensis]